jgi:hypothetical protein
MHFADWELHINPNITEEKIHEFEYLDSFRDFNIFRFTA